MADFHVLGTSDEAVVHPKIRRISVADVVDALRLGLNDFWERPSHIVFLFLIYPLIGAVLIMWASGGNALQLIYPIMSGFALLGPFAAVSLYEISRRREQKLDTSWVHAFEVWKSPCVPAIAAVGAMLLVLYVAWLFSAQLIYQSLFGSEAPVALWTFVGEVLTTQRGWALIIVGNGIGFVFALVALATTVIAFPLLLDRDVGALLAVETSVKAMLANPVPMLLWGLIVTMGLLIGSLPFLVGLAIVLPVLGHSTWHLYRKAVVAEREAT
ncbi:MAG: DUF2189 domain-containing protein [Stappiaceae bacterium]